MKDVIKHVKESHKMLKYYIYDGLDIGLNITLIHLTGPNAFKRPNWLDAKGAADYNAKRDRDKLIAEFEAHPGKYGYGILLGRQPGGFYLLCIDIDADNECKDRALEDLEKVFKKYDIKYYVETTKSNRYHIYIAINKINDKLMKMKKLKYHVECIKYKGEKQYKGEIELLGAGEYHVVTVYNGIINDKKPFYTEGITINPLERVLLALLEFQGVIINIDNDKLGEIYKLVKKYSVVDGWEIEKVVSAVCVKTGKTDEEIHEIFKKIYGEEYDERTTENLIKLTREKTPDSALPGIPKMISHIEELSKIEELTDEEKKLVSDFLAIFKKQEGNTLPEYLVDAEKAYLFEFVEKESKEKGKYYREWWYIERKIGPAKRVYFVEIETSHPGNIYKEHKKVGRGRFVGIKIEITRIIREGDSGAYEIIINDDKNRIYRPPTNFERLDDLAIAIAKQCYDLIGRFDIEAFQNYITIKLDEFYKKQGNNYQPCIVSKITGWDENCKMFFHYDLNDERHELGKDNPLYKKHKAISFNQEEQHELVRKLLGEGKLLGVLLVISASSILLKPLELQPLTCILAGNPGSGKTTSSYIATSLFYKSDTMIITADATRVGIERTLVSLNSLPLVIDEAALAKESSEFLKHLIFSVASGKGRTRAKKDLSVETNDILSNVFWTSETTDIDEIKRRGAFRRMIYLVVERWKDFTELFDLSEYKPHKVHAGCGVDYIKYAIENLDKIREIFENETKDFGRKYNDMTELPLTIYAGLIFLEQYYNQRFTELRRKIDEILEETKRLFVINKDDVVSLLQQYLYMNASRIGKVTQVSDENGGYKYHVERDPKVQQILGEYDTTTQTYYISTKGFEIISKELEMERTLFHKALVKAGVMSKTADLMHSKVEKSTLRFYTIRFNPPLHPPEQQPPQQPPQEPPSQPPTEPQSPQSSPLELPPPEPIKPEPPTEPPPQQQEPAIDEIDDALIEAFSRTTYEGKPQKPKIEDKEKEKAPQQPQEKKKSQKPRTKKATQAQPQPEKAQPQDQLITIEGNKIIVNEDKLNIYDVKPTTEIEDISDLENRAKSIKPFSELLVGSLDIETTGTKETDQILAIAFDVFKGDERVIQYRFYLSDYGDDESKMVSEFLDSLAASNIDVLTGYNIYSFDLKMIKSKDKDNKLQFDKEYNIANVIFINQQQQGYCITVNGIYIEVIDAMHLVIKYDNVARSIPAQNYDLKSVAKHFGISKEDRVILGADEIRQYYYTNRKLFDEYLSEDVREAYEVFKKLAPAYYYIKSIVPFDISFFTAFRSSTASIWERILEKAYTDEYKNTLTADDKMSYEGGLVIVNKGLYKNVYKIDVASLYPNIMLNYQVYSRKDTKKVGLIMLKAYTKLRLQLKAKAKAGDKEADLIQNSLKILINSLYGFYGTGGYLFNDMTASALVTAYGRKILKYMIDYVEANGGTIIECDTDGIFFSAVNGEEIYNGLRQELNKINFDIELEYKDCVMFASDKKNYIIITKDDKVIKKGSKYAGRDKNKLQTEFVVEYIKRYIDDPVKAEEYKKEIRDLIALEKAYDWLKVTKKVGKGEKNIIEDAKAKGVNLEQGSIVTCVFRNHRKHKYCFDWEPQKVYDVEHYLSEFQKLVNEIDSVIQRKQNDG